MTDLFMLRKLYEGDVTKNKLGDMITCTMSFILTVWSRNFEKVP